MMKKIFTHHKIDERNNAIRDFSMHLTYNSGQSDARVRHNSTRLSEWPSTKYSIRTYICLSVDDVYETA